jgi:D-glycero-D-manno-heptose 1,7-bisphosphate phosphatase
VRRAVFLDRDGVVNRSVVRDGKPFAAPTTPEEFSFAPGVGEALSRLHGAGFRLFVVTNQPDVKHGVQTRAAVEAIHERIRRLFPIDAVKACFHDDADGCACRKPKPGMLLDAAREWAIDLRGSFMVGDRWRDVEAGRAAGCRTVLVGDGYGEPLPAPPDATAPSLLDASRWILSRAGVARDPREGR